MITRTLLLSVLLSVPAGVMAGGNHTMTDEQHMLADNEQGIKVNAVVHSVSADKINVSHEQIPELGWPPMKMDFAVAPDLDVESIPTESPVELELIKGADGIYQVKAVTAAQ